MARTNISHASLVSLSHLLDIGAFSHLGSSLLTSVGATRFQESVSSRITLDDEDPAIIARMLLFIYIDTYPVSDIAAEGTGRGQFRTIIDPFKNDATDTPEWATRANLHALMFAAAEKYWVLGLQKHSAHRFLAAFSEDTDFELQPERGVRDRPSSEGASYLDHAEGLSSDPRKLPEQVGTSTTSDVVDAWVLETSIIRQVYTSTPAHCRTLRNIVVCQVKLSTARCADDDQHKGPLESESILALLQELPEVAFDLASTVITKRMYRCFNCEQLKRAFVRRCKCGKLDRCVKPECLERMQQESICPYCFCLGTLVFTAGDIGRSGTST